MNERNHHGPGNRSGHDQPGAPALAKATDPVCGMTVDPATARTYRHKESSYYFCSEGCRAKFKAYPERYLAATPATTVAKPAPGKNGEYTCPR